ncbi:MAG: helix-turn-helix transcriptional regulator [Verrucomicrobiota bacterium]
MKKPSNFKAFVADALGTNDVACILGLISAARAAESELSRYDWTDELGELRVALKPFENARVCESGDSIGERIRRIRRGKNLSLDALAKSAGISKGNLSKIESIAGNPTLETLLKIARALGVSAADLIPCKPSPSR